MLTYSGTQEICKRDIPFMNELGKGMQSIFVDLLDLRSGLAFGKTLKKPELLEENHLYNHMPKVAIDQLTLDFCERLISSHITLAFKSFTPEPATPACIAEDMLLVWSTDQMFDGQLDQGIHSEDIDNFLGSVIGDLDFRLAENPVYEQIAAQPELGMISLHDDWFRPYNRPLDLTHPFTWPQEFLFDHQQWAFLKERSEDEES